MITKGNASKGGNAAAPAASELSIPSLAAGQGPPGTVEKVELLGRSGALEFARTATGLAVKMPAEMPGIYAVCLKITGLELGSAP